ncbi:MAG: hypothetical protein M1816_006819 [Peltula sp. TS41687]|nr:MAG: hypothetical protein M1816_006819 [Peltula sp. TS41687]
MSAAAGRGSLELVRLLVRHGAQVSGTGALPAAAEEGHLDVVRYLLDQGADIDEVGVFDYGDIRKHKNLGTALHKALRRGDHVMAKLLRDRGANPHLPSGLEALEQRLGMKIPSRVGNGRPS